MRPMVFSLALTLPLAVAAPSAADYPPTVPAQLRLVVRETAGVARSGEVLRSGVPIPRELALLDPSGLAVVDAAGILVPAEFHVLARWNAGPTDPAAPIQWLLVAFPASVAANGSAVYRLVTDGSSGPNPPPDTPLVVTENGGLWTVDTGAARFTFGGTAGALFDGIRAGDGTLLATGVGGTARVGPTTYTTASVSSVVFERQGPLTATAVVRTAYAMPPVGGGGLTSEVRYEFRAGSPAAIVRRAVAWEGDRCGLDQRVCGGTPNGVRLERVRDAIDLGLGFPLTVSAVGDFEAPALVGSATASDTAALRQLQRASRQAPLAFSASVPGGAASGAKADGGVLAATTAVGTLAVALDHLHRFEPQALRLLAGGRLAIDLVDAPVWLANRQGLYAEMAVAALPAGAGRADLDRLVWAPLDRRLRAWPSAEWWASSRAVEELPVGPLSGAWAGYDALVGAVLDTTLADVDAIGLSGLTTYGLFPRHWGNPIYADEVDCFDDDPTPADDVDDLFWCASWTDYHNASVAAAVRAFRTGEVEWLDEISEPAALRMLYTQIVQCGDGDPFFFCGQAPTGYGAYRADFNSSHAYFDNLLLHYWLTGDGALMRRLLDGAATMRSYLCATRTGPPGGPGGPLCAPVEPISDEWAAINGRVAIQWLRTFRFLGLAADAEFLDDASSTLARSLTRYWAQPGSGAGARGFLVPSGGGSLEYVSGPGSYWTTTPWMDGLYDLDFVARWRVDSEDAPLGAPALAPSEVELAWARTMREIADAPPFGTGGAETPWPNSVRFTFAGSRIGGTLTGLVFDIDADGDGMPCEICDDDGDGDPGTCADICLYDDGKPGLGGPLARAAALSGDAALWNLAESFATFGLERTEILPLSKPTGSALARLHAAVAYASARGLVFRDGFEAGDTSAWSSTEP